MEMCTWPNPREAHNDPINNPIGGADGDATSVPVAAATGP
jgi:hypothetical protein